MLWDAATWKNDLLRLAGRLERRGKQARWTIRSRVSVQQDVLWAMFAIRRMCEVGALPGDFDQPRMTLTSFRPRPEKSDEAACLLDYQFDSGKRDWLRVVGVFNGLIHSDYFALGFRADGTLGGIYFRATRHPNRSGGDPWELVFLISLDGLLELIQSAADETTSVEVEAESRPMPALDYEHGLNRWRPRRLAERRGGAVDRQRW